MLVEEYRELMALWDAQELDNKVTAARVDTPPPPKVTGLAPPGAYDDQKGHDMSDSALMQKFQEDLPEAAEIPDIQKQFKANFEGMDQQNEPAQDNTNDIKPPRIDL